MGRYLVQAHLREGRPVAELAAAHGVHPSWIYRLLARYRADGDAGLIPRSRRPKTSPTALAPPGVALGDDHGAALRVQQRGIAESNRP
jgi:transposase-like protein